MPGLINFSSKKDQFRILGGVLAGGGVLGFNTAHVISVKDDPTGFQLANVGDYLRLKAWTGTGLPGSALPDNWLLVTALDSTPVGHTDYSYTLANGTPANFQAGTAVARYRAGPAGLVFISSDDLDGPFLSVRNWLTVPWVQTEQVRVGNLKNWGKNNGVGTTPFVGDTYGFAAGQYGVASGKSWVLVDPNNGVQLGKDDKARLQLDTSGTIHLYDQASVERLRLDSAGIITIGRVSTANESSLLLTGGGLSIRQGVANTERIGLTSAGVLTIKDSGGAAVLTFDAAAGAELTKKLVMKAAPISIGAVPPLSAASGTGIWLDQTGLYGLVLGVPQIKINAVTGSLMAGNGAVALDIKGITVGPGGAPWNGTLSDGSTITLGGTGAIFNSQTAALGSIYNTLFLANAVTLSNTMGGTVTNAIGLYLYDNTFSILYGYAGLEFDYGNTHATFTINADASLLHDLSLLGDATFNRGLSLGTAPGAAIGSINASGGINVGTPTTAAAGEIFASGQIASKVAIGIDNPRIVFYDDGTNNHGVTIDASVYNYFKSSGSRWYWQQTTPGASRWTGGVTRMLLDSGNLFVTGTITGSSGLNSTLSQGTAVFALDTQANGTTLAANATMTPFGNANNFAGMFVVVEIAYSTQAIFLTGSGVVTLVSQTSNRFSTVLNNGATINVYLVGGVVTIQNKFAGSSEVRVMAFRDRNTN